MKYNLEKLKPDPTQMADYKRASIYEKAEILRKHFDEVYREIDRIGIKVHKSDSISVEMRAKANLLFNEGNFDLALNFYNKSICFAENGSENLGIGYAARSLAYFSMGHYEECLKSVNFAKNSNCPENLMPKLLERENKCLEYLEKVEKEEKKIPKGAKFNLCYRPNEKIPFLADCVEVKKSEIGKGLYATRDIHVGDIVEIEDTFAKTLNVDQFHHRCTNCYDEKYKNLIPCDSCTKVMFCSEECKKKAWADFHELDCGMIDGLILNDDYMAFIVSKIIWTALNAFKTIGHWIKFFECDREKIKNLNIDYKNYSMRNKYESMLGLVPTYDCVNNEMEGMVLAALRLQKLILRNKTVKHRFQYEREKTFLFRAIFHQYYTSKVYTSTISATPKMEWLEWSYNICKIKREIGHSITTIFNLINHSCSPSVMRVEERKNLILIAIRPIKKGQQLFSCYG